MAGGCTSVACHIGQRRKNPQMTTGRTRNKRKIGDCLEITIIFFYTLTRIRTSASMQILEEYLPTEIGGII